MPPARRKKDPPPPRRIQTRRTTALLSAETETVEIVDPTKSSPPIASAAATTKLGGSDNVGKKCADLPETTKLLHTTLPNIANDTTENNNKNLLELELREEDVHDNATSAHDDADLSPSPPNFDDISLQNGEFYDTVEEEVDVEALGDAFDVEAELADECDDESKIEDEDDEEAKLEDEDDDEAKFEDEDDVEDKFEDEDDVEDKFEDDDDSRDADYKPRDESDDDSESEEEVNNSKGCRAINSLLAAVDDDFFMESDTESPSMSSPAKFRSPRRAGRPAVQTKFTLRKPPPGAPQSELEAYDKARKEFYDAERKKKLKSQ